jgi:lipid-A-disaccharide synthase
VNYTELNQHIGRALRARGTRVLWCVAPQVWAWRPGRLVSLRGATDVLAVVLPFEEAMWRAAGHDAVYVGHPSVPAEPPVVHAGPATLAVLPGSRRAEIARLAPAFVEAARVLVNDGSVASARMVLAPDLPARAIASLRARAADAGISVALADPVHGAAPLIAGATVALCASGTATLEAALVGAAPVVAYRLGPVAFALAKRLVRTPHVALPNVLLGRRAFPELLQDEVTAPRLASAARALIANRAAWLGTADELRSVLTPPSGASFGERVADLIRPWLTRSSA